MAADDLKIKTTIHATQQAKIYVSGYDLTRFKTPALVANWKVVVNDILA